MHILPIFSVERLHLTDVLSLIHFTARFNVKVELHSSDLVTGFCYNSQKNHDILVV